MKYQLTILLFSIITFSCSENQPKKEEIKTTSYNSFMNVTDSTDKENNLTHLQYQNLTAWGGLEVWYKNKEIIKVVATQKPEYGFTKTSHFYENSSNTKSIVVSHIPNWDELEKLDSITEENISYIDDTVSTDVHDSHLDSFDLQMIKEASELLIFISNENKIMP